MSPAVPDTTVRTLSGRARTGRVLVALGVLSVAVGLNVSVAGASGEQTTAVLTSPLAGASSTTFTWSYQFHSNGGHDLSNIAIGFCSTDALPLVVQASPSGEAFLVGDVPGGHTGFGPGVKFATTQESGTLTVVFSQPQVAGGTIRVQSHSGDGQAGDLITLADGPGNCNPTTTTTVGPATTTTVPQATTSTVAPVTTTTAPPATTTTDAPVTTTTAPPATTTTVAPVTTTSTLPGPTTSVAGVRFSSTTTTVPAQTTTSVPTSVLGARFTNDDNAANLAKTGFNGAPAVALGFVLVMLGLALVVADRIQPAER